MKKLLKPEAQLCIETWSLRKVEQNYRESFQMCWRRMEKISWTDRVRNEEVLQTFEKRRNMVHTIKRRKDNWIGHILHRNCFIKRAVE